MTTYMTPTAETATIRTSAIKLHGPEGFEGMRKAGRLAAEILDAIAPMVVPGAVTSQIDDAVRTMMLDAGAVPATLGYHGYQYSCCISLNNVICHGMPGERVLKDGDILNIDVTPLVDGWHGDTSRMYLVGDVPIKARRLVDVTYECLMLGIEQARPGNTLGDVGYAIQTHAEKHRFTIEPMINAGKPAVKMLEDGWTAVTRDRSLSAQFEHSIGITEDGCEIFTLSPKGLHRPPY